MKKMRDWVDAPPLWLWIIIFLLSCIAKNNQVHAKPKPLSPMVPENPDNLENFQEMPPMLGLLSKLTEQIAEKRSLAKRHLEIEGFFFTQVRNQHLLPIELSEEIPEMLPVPSAMVQHGPPHSEKRTSYMNLCHFKICNMGRKRQLPP